MTTKTLAILLIGLGIAGGAEWVYHASSSASTAIAKPYCALGNGAAEETASLIGKSGHVVIVMPEKNTANPIFTEELDCFRKALKTTGISINREVKFKLTQLQVVEAGGLLPRDELFGVLQGQSKPDAVVLFCGFPRLSPEDCEAVKQSGTKVIVVSAVESSFSQLLRDHVIQLAIVPRPDQPSPGETKKQSTRQIFESQYVVLTPDNFEIAHNQ
jgi:hypothetical protein